MEFSAEIAPGPQGRANLPPTQPAEHRYRATGWYQIRNWIASWEMGPIGIENRFFEVTPPLPCQFRIQHRRIPRPFEKRLDRFER